MSDEFSELDWEQLNAFFAEQVPWANLSISIDEIAQDNKLLIRDLSRYDPKFAIPLIAGLLTVPKLQSHCVRLEILVTLAVVYCRGRKKANIKQAIFWFSQIGKSKCIVAEDPAEDVFVSLVRGKTGDYCLLEGIWEDAGFYTQCVHDVIVTMPDTGKFGQIKRSIHALLVISDLVCGKAGLHRYQLGSDEHYSVLTSQMLPGRKTLTSRVMLTLAELDEYGITLDDIEPFLFDPKLRITMPAQQIGLSHLDRHPLIIHETTHLTIALPTALSIAVRDYAISCVIEYGLVETFDGVLARYYSELFFDTPLFGGPMRAPVYWKKTGMHKWSDFYFQVDEGYFISFHLFLPSIQTHPDGGFNGTYAEQGILSETLQTSINEVLERVESQDDFKEGIAVLVGCGWGKGYAIQNIELNNLNWRFESMSAPDLVRLSWLDNMNPSYFWRIHDGLEAVTKAGVRIINPNGILNLIGWVRRNDGHFVPHTQLPEGEISPERPLILNLPINLLRDVRADSDHGYDRHSTFDNNGVWHEVQHASPNPYFSSESERRVYISIDGIEDGKFTSVYEGVIQLWMSITAPNIANRDLVFQLWEMTREWLHRIGNVLDEHYGSLNGIHILKVYIEFCDSDPPSKGVEKPLLDDLIPLCIIEASDEPNAYKAVFRNGFLPAFRIAENVAERLFVRTLIRAYLCLLGVENYIKKAEELEPEVVPNDNARSFHFFHAHQFIDYVQDTLPERVISVDSVDDAAAKIGLGLGISKKVKPTQSMAGRHAPTFLKRLLTPY